MAQRRCAVPARNPGRSSALHLHLIDAIEPVFDRVFDRDDLGVRADSGGAAPNRGSWSCRCRWDRSRAPCRHCARSGSGNELEQLARHARAHRDVIRLVDWSSSRITTDSPYWVGMVDRRTSMALPPTFTREAPVLRQSLLGDVEAAHELQARHQRAGDAAALDHLLLQMAVDALAHSQRTFAGLDVQIGRAQPASHRGTSIWISRMTGASGEPSSAASCSMSMSRLPQLIANLLRDGGDLVGVPIDASMVRSRSASLNSAMRIGCFSRALSSS